jgi:hypothetical protein
MTKVKIIKKNNSITVVEALGHTGYAESGEDIVCAALSSIIQTAALGLLGVLGIKAQVKKDDKSGYFKISLTQELSNEDRKDADIILNTMLMGITDLNEGYSNFIE